MSAVLGVDVSSHNVDLVKLDEDTNHAQWHRIPLTGPTAFDRLRTLQMPTASYFDDVYIAGIETPKTRFMASAAALLPVYGAAIHAMPAALQVWPVHPKTWRSTLGLKGNATKAEVAAQVLELAPAIAHEWPQDALDAYAVALYVRTINQQAIDQEKLP